VSLSQLQASVLLKEAKCVIAGFNIWSPKERWEFRSCKWFFLWPF